MNNLEDNLKSLDRDRLREALDDIASSVSRVESAFLDFQEAKVNLKNVLKDLFWDKVKEDLDMDPVEEVHPIHIDLDSKNRVVLFVFDIDEDALASIIEEIMNGFSHKYKFYNRHSNAWVFDNCLLERISVVAYKYNLNLSSKFREERKSNG